MDSLSDWERPLSQEELDAIEAASESASSLIKRKSNSTLEPETISPPAKKSRRLPNWGTQQQSSSTSDQDSGPRNQDFSIIRHHHQVTAKQKYPSIRFGGQIVYCTTYSQVEKASLELLKFIESKAKNMDQISLGLDIEWRPTFRRGEVPRNAAVMQICGDISRCYVLHIIHSGIPPALQLILEDPKYVKVGVCIAGDADKPIIMFTLNLWRISLG